MLVENFVDITLSHLAGIIVDLSVLLKMMPDFRGAGLRITLVLTPVCNPIPSIFTDSLRVKLLIYRDIMKIPKKYYFIFVKLCIYRGY